MSIAKLLKADEEKILKIASDYPVQVPVPVVAELLGCNPENVRQAIDEGKLGLSWKNPGRVNHVPTVHFVRWYLRING